MGLTNYGFGVTSFGMPVLGGGILTTGNVFFVDSGHSLAADAVGHGTVELPFATIDYAVGRCAANNSDHIMVMPGHSETISGAGGITVDVAGVTIVGVGHGAARPTVSFTDTASTFIISSASCTIYNMLFTGDVDAIVTMFTISAADCTLKSIETRDVTGQMVDCITSDANADRLLIDGWIHRGAAGDGGDHALILNGADDQEVKNFQLYGNFDEGAIEAESAATVRTRIHDGLIWTEGAEDLAIVMLTGSTGVIGPNLQIVLQDDAANIDECLVGDAMYYIDPIYIVNAVAEKAMLTPITATTDAIV